MYQRRSQGDSKSTSSIGGSTSSMPVTNNPSSTSTTGRVSIYSMRERVILNKMTKIMGKLAPDTETEVTSRLHQEIPAIRLDGHLTYCLYFTLQNFIHLNTIYILLYHSVFWFNISNPQNELYQTSRLLEETQHEQTHFITIPNDYYYPLTRQAININFINLYVYLSLIGISSIELFSTFLWTIRKKLPYFFQRNQKFKNRLSKLLIGIIIMIYLLFNSWLIYHTFVTHKLTSRFFFLIFGHLIFLTFLDKPNLFQESPYNFSKQSTGTRKQQYRNSTSSSSTSSISTNILSRLSYRSSTSTQPRKINQIINSTSSPLSTTTTTTTPATTLISWSRWLSITEEKLDVHECSTFYAQARQEADDLWPSVVRRIILNIYRTFSSFILYDLIPIKMMSSHVRSLDTQPIKLLICILTLNTFLTHSAFLFPVKLQTNLHRIATHLGQWREQSNMKSDTTNEWSSECNSYTRGSVVKFSSNNQYFIAIQHLSNAANPQSKSHSLLYRLFGDATYFLTIQFSLAIILVIFNIIWILRGKCWEQIVIGCLIIFSSSYPIYKIIRDRIIMDLVEEHEVFQTSTTSKQKKSS